MKPSKDASPELIKALTEIAARIAAHEVTDIAITTPDVEDLFLRQYRDHGLPVPEEVPA